MTKDLISRRYADPYATGIASWHGVKGMLDAGVQTCSQHYILNEQETFRSVMQKVPISSNVNDKTNHEVYL
ncbi:hypothetical protein BKA56DRAFT_479062 [Ilyonectria sp. MPI-CAGE-AT-0026]|nr:hypothetical protein BKA56DRAFT_479062 [Ilyonectria sp. MPI-CAGE-AT-0026]